MSHSASNTFSESPAPITSQTSRRVPGWRTRSANSAQACSAVSPDVGTRMRQVTVPALPSAVHPLFHAATFFGAPPQWGVSTCRFLTACPHRSWNADADN